MPIKSYLTAKKAKGRCPVTRLYIQPSFLDSCSDHGEWSGGNDQYRGDRSIDVSTFDKNGRARVEAFSDDAIAALKEKRKTSIPLRDKILPQRRRVNTLTDQIIELENAYKSGEMSQAEYTMLRAVLYMKRDRAIELYKKAINVAQSRNESTKDSVESDVQNGNGCATTPQQEEIVTGTFLDEISSENSLKLFAQRALQVGRVLVRWVIKTKQYINELKAV